MWELFKYIKVFFVYVSKQTAFFLLFLVVWEFECFEFWCNDVNGSNCCNSGDFKNTIVSTIFEKLKILSIYDVVYWKDSSRDVVSVHIYHSCLTLSETLSHGQNYNA